MSNMRIGNSQVGTLHSQAYSNPTKDTDFYDGSSINTDGVTGVSDSSWTNDWAKWHGYYMDIPIFAAVVDTIATWTVGKGYKTDDKTKQILDRIKGWGKDDFNSIIENLIRTMCIGGDAFAEIVKDKAGRLTNLKPLNPSTIKVVVNQSGIIDHYEQVINKKKVGDNYSKEKIFHLCWDRLADEIHGKPMAERTEPIIKQIKQLQEDLGIRFHRIVRPVRLYKSSTDDETELKATEAKLAAAYKNAEIIVIPEKTLEEQPGSPIPSAQDVLIYLDYLTRNFVTANNVPEIILGWNSKSTEASSKVVYLAFQQPTERKQKFIEEQMRLQLGIEIDFEFPASLEPAMTTPGVTGTIGAETPKVNTPASDIKKSGKLNSMGVDPSKKQK